MEKPYLDEMIAWSKSSVTKWVIKELEEILIDKVCDSCYTHNDTCEKVALKRVYSEGYSTGIEEVINYIQGVSNNEY